MPSMSYCRFQNAASDLYEIVNEGFEDKVSAEEHKARLRLFKYCKQLVDDYETEANVKSLPHED